MSQLVNIDLLYQDCIDIIQDDNFAERLVREKLVVKAGFDPTSPDLHLGHSILLHKLKQFQNLGHKIVIVVGDFTALIGDPSGRDITRKPLTKEDIKVNCATYKDQLFKILDKEKTILRYNSEWFSTFSAEDIIKLSSKYTVSRMLERDDFSKRYKSNKSISVHEFLYPLLQGYDSVHIKADIELGGSDQLFNLLVGRELQRQFQVNQQSVLTVPLLEGLDGIKKMSKSYNNHIGLLDTSEDMFGKIMSISDELMWKYALLLRFKNNHEIEELRHSDINPRDIKVKLGEFIIQKYYDDQTAVKTSDNFKQRFSKKIIPKDIEIFEIDLNNFSQKLKLSNVLKLANLTATTSEAMRLIKQNAVKIDNNVVSENIEFSENNIFICQVGKRKIKKIKII